MNTFFKPMHRNSIIAIAVAAALFAGCSSQPTKSEGALSARSRLVQLQSNSELATRAPLAIKEADVAVTAAEQPQKDKALETHLVFVANHKIDIAQARAESSLAVDQRKALGEQRDAMRLQARTNEADSANRRANAAQADATIQKRDADVARDARAIAQRDADVSRDAATIAQRDASVSRDAAENAQRDAGAARDATNVAQRDADSAREATASAQRNARELQAQIDTLQAKVTDRGLVLTLGDVLFTSGTANLNSGANSHLGKLAAFLNKYPERKTTIEGYTDSVGSDDFNQGLSQRRAEAVRSYLIGQGILAGRLTASGKGESSPVGDNSTATGRQQNRRVEVIVENNLVSAR